MSDCKVIKVNFNENELAKMVNCKVDKEVVRATEAEQEITNSLNESVSDLNESIRETNESISDINNTLSHITVDDEKNIKLTAGQPSSGSDNFSSQITLSVKDKDNTDHAVIIKADDGVGTTIESPSPFLNLKAKEIVKLESANFGSYVYAGDDGSWMVYPSTSGGGNHIQVGSDAIGMGAPQIVFNATARTEDEHGGFVFGMLDDGNEHCELTIDNRSYGAVHIEADSIMEIGGSYYTTIFNQESNNRISVADDGLWFNGGVCFEECTYFTIEGSEVHLCLSDDEGDSGHLKIYTKEAMFTDSVFLENIKSDIYVVGNNHAFIVGESQASLCSHDAENPNAIVQVHNNDAVIEAKQDINMKSTDMYLDANGNMELDCNEFSLNSEHANMGLGEKNNNDEYPVKVYLEDDTIYFDSSSSVHDAGVIIKKQDKDTIREASFCAGDGAAWIRHYTKESDGLTYGSYLRVDHDNLECGVYGNDNTKTHRIYLNRGDSMFVISQETIEISSEDDIELSTSQYSISLNEYLTPTFIPETWVDGATLTTKKVNFFITEHSIIMYDDGETVFQLKHCDHNNSLKGQDISIDDNGVVTIKTVVFKFQAIEGERNVTLSVTSKTKTIDIEGALTEDY